MSKSFIDGIPVTGTKAVWDTINNALAGSITQPDVYMPNTKEGTLSYSKPATIATPYDTSDVAKRNLACSQINDPSILRTPASDRTGCGWIFNPSQPSLGAYGDRHGPADSAHMTGGAEWIWDPTEAAKRESFKRANTVKNCQDLALYGYPDVGWCSTTNRAIPIDSNGNPAYPTAQGFDCQGGQILTKDNSSQMCPPPIAASSAPGGGSSNPPPPSITQLCQSDPKTPGCIKALNELACSPNGLLSQSLRSGFPMDSNYTNQQFELVNKYLTKYNFNLHPGIIKDGKITLNEALYNIRDLRYAANGGYANSATAAAANLCFGTPFNPCYYNFEETGPFEPSCIRKVALDAGYSENGLMLSVDIMKKYNTANNTWGNLLQGLQRWKQQADYPADGNYEFQKIALKYVYGVEAKYPKLGCNTTGILMYRYFLPPGVTISSIPAYPNGPIVPFLGRYLHKAALPFTLPTASEQTPAGGFKNEAQRLMTMFNSPVTGTFYFAMFASTNASFYIVDTEQNPPTANNPAKPHFSAGPALTVSPPISLIAKKSYLFIWDFYNTGTQWDFGFSFSVNGGQAVQIPIALCTIPYDRRLPMIDLPFHTMSKTAASQAGKPLQDTQGVLSTLLNTAAIDSLGGQQCMVISKPGEGVFNYNTTAQGVRLRSMKSITMKLYISSVSVVAGVTPTIVSFFNLPESTTLKNKYGRPRAYDPRFVQKYTNRVNDFSIMANSTQVYPMGRGALKTTGSTADTFFLESAMNNRSIASPGAGKWFHYAFVWNEDGAGYTIYVDGKKLGNAYMPSYDPVLLMEQIRIGCDTHPEGAMWAGGIAWFRGFDYCLDEGLVQMDMNDAWSSIQ
jgi:hypothetical protein